MTETLADGWIAWHGGECPVSDSTPIEVKFRCGDTGSADAGSWSWRQSALRGEYEIVAYRAIVKPPRDELERFVRQVWGLLDGVTEMMGDTLWADAETTVHEAMIEIVNEYRPKLAAQLRRELEL